MKNTDNGLPLPDARGKTQLSHHLLHGRASSFELELEVLLEVNDAHSYRLHSHRCSCNFSCQHLRYLMNSAHHYYFFKVMGTNEMHIFPIYNCIEVIS